MERQEAELEPRESPSMEIAQVISEGDPEEALALLERKAQIAPRWVRAMSTILITQTYPEDWTEQGGKMCLSSAGAERVGRLFPIQFQSPTCTKETFTDALGKGYRYVYEALATLGDRTVFAQGAYSTRDKFLGFVDGEWRPVEDINENNIRNAAYHVCLGNGIKALLGLRGIPAERFHQIMAEAGQNGAKATQVVRGSGTQGGTTADDAAQQKELAEICLYIAQAGMTVQQSEKGAWGVTPISEADERTGLELAKEICILLSGFVGRTGKRMPGRAANDLHKKWLTNTLATARRVKAALDSEEDGHAGDN